MPIIESLLDTDIYKLLMGQWIFHRYPDVPVVSGFKNRTSSVRLAEFIDEGRLREELDHVTTLRPTVRELDYLRDMPKENGRLFQRDYLNFFAQLKCPDYELRKVEGTYELTFPGPWSTQTYWELYALPIINELYFESLTKSMSINERNRMFAEGRRRLAEKNALIKTRPNITFSEFGTRRRFSNRWQHEVDWDLCESMSGQFIGTSNVLFSMEFGTEPRGTVAHELFMVMTGVMHESWDQIRRSQAQVLAEWWEEYGYALSNLLPDTYGTPFFLSILTPQQVWDWKASRQDSEEPKIYGDRMINFYRSHGVDPKTKFIVFSDGLTAPEIVDIYDYFDGRIQSTFGWGTNLTNDLGFKALSLIIKPILANGHRLVKLSDNIAKATGRPEDIELFKQIFNYTGTYSQECKY